MKLVNFQIKNYKVIDDTGSVKVDPQVTALVGKNESGKTGVFKAIWKSRNVADVEFDKLYDYPRDRYSRDRKGTQEVTVLEFELSEEEIENLVAHLPEEPASTPKRITYTTFYAGEENVEHEIDFDTLSPRITGTQARSAIEALVRPILQNGHEDTKPVHEASSIALNQIGEDALLWDQTVIAGLESVSQAVETWIGADAARQELATQERNRLSEVIKQAKQGDPLDIARSWADDHIPIFVYFDDYGQLETRIHLPMYLKRKDTPDPRIRTQTALFEWSGVDPKCLSGNIMNDISALA